jgi:hypothetical protein
MEAAEKKLVGVLADKEDIWFGKQKENLSKLLLMI